MVERHNVAAAREAAQGGQVAMIADLDVRDDLRCTVVGDHGEHPQPNSKRDRCRLHHSGQLTATDDSDDRKPVSPPSGHPLTIPDPSQ